MIQFVLVTVFCVGIQYAFQAMFGMGFYSGYWAGLVAVVGSGAIFVLVDHVVS